MLVSGKASFGNNEEFDVNKLYDSDDDKVQELCQALDKTKISEGNGRLALLSKDLVGHVISFLPLNEKRQAALICKAAYNAYQTVHAFKGYDDSALNAHLRKLKYPVNNPSFVKYFKLFGPQMRLLELNTEVPEALLVTLKNFVPTIQEVRLAGIADANTLRGVVRTWPKIVGLDVREFMFAESFLAHITSCSYLRTLQLPYALFDHDLEKLKPLLHNLEELCVNAFRHTVKGWSFLARECPNLKKLQMYDQVGNFYTITCNFNTTTCPYLQAIQLYNHFSKDKSVLHNIAETMEIEQNNRAIYMFFLEGYFKEGKLERARELFNNMKKDNLPLTPWIYASFIKAYAAAGNFVEAEKMLQEMKNGHYGPYKRVASIETDEALAALIEAYLKAGKFEDVKRLEQMIENGVRTEFIVTFDVSSTG